MRWRVAWATGCEVAVFLDYKGVRWLLDDMVSELSRFRHSDCEEVFDKLGSSTAYGLGLLRDGLRESVSHLPILTDFTILILVISPLAKFLANYQPSIDLLILYRLAVCSGIASSFLSFTHGELITIFGAVVRPTLGELSAIGYPVQGSVML
nr:hypothetical protein [Tanacetum cinerariifolium]